MMRTLALFAFLLAGCAPVAHDVVIEHAPSPTEASRATAERLQCKSPARASMDNDAEVDAVFFGTCAAFERVFYTSMADACVEAMPAISEALRAVANDRLVLPAPRGSEGWQARDRKSFTLFQASRAFVPARCTSDFNVASFPGDDYGRPIADVSHLWRDVPGCRPDRELFTMRSAVQDRSESFEQGDVDVGVYMLALALAPHLTPLGSAYLRKYLLCDELEHKGEESPWRRRVALGE